MGIQEYKITNKETGESHFAVPYVIGNETVTFKLQDTGEEIIFSNIGAVGDLQNELFTAETVELSQEEVEAQIKATEEAQSTPAQIGEDAELELVVE